MSHAQASVWFYAGRLCGRFQVPFCSVLKCSLTHTGSDSPERAGESETSRGTYVQAAEFARDRSSLTRIATSAFLRVGTTLGGSKCYLLGPTRCAGAS